ncbi:MAG: hypothetical protein S4CHLAM37_09920 [Chlamydiia bacterium]|nr:hypothetical protein [Chlamydiia bacterium]
MRVSEPEKPQGMIRRTYNAVKKIVNNTIDGGLLAYSGAAYTTSAAVALESLRFFATGYVKVNGEDPQAILLKSNYSYLLKDSFDPKNPSKMCSAFESTYSNIGSTVGAYFKRYMNEESTIPNDINIDKVLEDAKKVTQEEVDNLFSGFDYDPKVAEEAVENLKKNPAAEKDVQGFFAEHLTNSPFGKLASHITYASYQTVKETVGRTYNAVCNGGVSSYQQYINQGYTLMFVSLILGLSALAASATRSSRKQSRKVSDIQGEKKAVIALFQKQRQIIEKLLQDPAVQKSLMNDRARH